MVDVTIIIVTYNSGQAIETLLESLRRESVDAAVQVIVVDNGSTDDTLKVVRQQSWVTLVPQTNRGYAAGINRGMAESPGAGAYVILNPDLVLHEGALQALLDQLRDPAVGIAAPRIIGPTGALELSQRREPTLLRAAGLSFTKLPIFSEYVQEQDAYSRTADIDWALGAAMIVRRECADSVGPWDESYFLYSEETDFCSRARAQGWTVRYAPAATAVHVGGGSGRNDRTHVMQIVNKVRYYAKAHSRAAGLAYWAITIASELTWIARGHSQSKASVKALLVPHLRPAELKCSRGLIPR